jgi:UDPglucose 6-dehydrogenase
MENDPRYAIGTWDEAEAIKIFYNTFISTKIGLVNMIQDVAMKSGNINVDVVTDALGNADMRIISKKYLTAGMGDAGPCHPRDNIALRWLAENLDLGYDIFNTVMHAREIQAKNLALFLHNLQKETNLPIIIHGMAYKPDVDFLDGSYSLLIGSYLNEVNADFDYCDPLCGRLVEDGVTAIVLLAHNRQITYGYTGELPEQQLYYKVGDDSVIVDPWRKFKTDTKSIKVIHYGNTRGQV